MRSTLLQMMAPDSTLGRTDAQNDGDHATVEKRAACLYLRDHPIKITYYNRGGPAELRVFMEGPE